MTPETKKAAVATYAATKELIFATTDLMIAFFHLSVKASHLSYNLGAELRYAVDNFIEEQERKARKLLNPAAEAPVISVESVIVEDDSDVETTILEDESDVESTILEDQQDAEVEATVEAADPQPNLDELTVRQLTEMAAELGIKFPKRPKKAELVDAIKTHRPETHSEHREEPTKTIQIQTGRIGTRSHQDIPEMPVGIQAHSKRETGSYLAELIVA